jgi:hypothetical protein
MANYKHDLWQTRIAMPTTHFYDLLHGRNATERQEAPTTQ